jgi:hypothetical protein
VTVPVGLWPPETVARSVTELPMLIVEELTALVTVGVAFTTLRVSPVAPHAVVAGLLFASPLYTAVK